MRLGLLMLMLVILTMAAVLVILEPRQDLDRADTEPPSPSIASPREAVEFTPPARKNVAPARYDAVVMGRFKDLHGEGLRSVAVELACEEGEQRAVSNRQGTFVVTVETRSDQGYSALLRGCKRGFATHIARITLQPGEIVDLGDLVMVRGGSVSGRVMDRSGNPLAGASVFLVDEIVPMLDPRLITWHHFGPPEPWLHEVKTASNGVFRMKGLPPGPIQVWASAEGMMYEHTFQPFEVRAGLDTPGIKLKLNPMPPSEVIKGQVLSPSGAPVPGAVIRVGDRTLTADEQGFFRFCRNSRSTRYVIKAWDPGGRFLPAGMRNVPIGMHDLILRLGRRDPAGE